MIKVNATSVNMALKRLSKGVNNDRVALRAAAMASDRIKTRTLEGKDYRGRKFKGYSKGYLAQKKAKGGSSKVDLFDSGEMFRSMQWRRSGKMQAVISFVRNNKGQADYALAHHTGTRMPKREFFRLSTEDKKEIRELIRRGIRR